MKIDIYSQKLSMTKALSNYAKRRLKFALSSKSESINKVTMRLSDINGPRGGEDKCCRIQVKLTGLPDIVVEDIQLDMYASIDRACDRVNRTIVRKLDRRQTLLRQAPSIIFTEESDKEIAA
jgi:ribosome hibernation promoting factor